MMRCTYAAGLSSVGEFYCNRNANRFESWPAVPGGHSDRISGKGDAASGARPVHPGPVSKYKLVEGLVVYFLYFEFIALIVKYFESGFHFPLRYFVYIGITAIVRLIIIDHESPMAVLIYSAAILILVITLWLCNSNRLKRE